MNKLKVRKMAATATALLEAGADLVSARPSEIFTQMISRGEITPSHRDRESYSIAS